MDYEIKPTVKSASVKVALAEKQRTEDNIIKEIKDKEKRKDAKDTAYKEQKEKMHSEMLDSNKDISEAIDSSSTNLAEVIADLGNRVGINLEIPELLEGDKISKSISDSTGNIEKILTALVKSVALIKLEQKDTSPHLKAISDVVSKNTSQIKSSLKDINQSVSDIRLEQDYPVEWVFDVVRNDKGYIDRVIASATDFGDEE